MRYIYTYTNGVLSNLSMIDLLDSSEMQQIGKPCNASSTALQPVQYLHLSVSSIRTTLKDRWHPIPTSI